VPPELERVQHRVQPAGGDAVAAGVRRNVVHLVVLPSNGENISKKFFL
jgi:hypothetical protein